MNVLYFCNYCPIPLHSNLNKVKPVNSKESVVNCDLETV